MSAIAWFTKNISFQTETVFFLVQKQSNYLNKFVLQFSNWGSKKLARKVKLKQFDIMNMSDPKIEALLSPFRVRVQEQGNIVRSLKESGAPDLDIKKAVAELKTRKKILEDKELEFAPKTACFDRSKLEDLLKRRFFYDQSFAIYGGITGQYDFGPMGCALKSNILNLWRNFFVMEEQMLEVDCSILTPESVLKASGHVDRFADLMVKDLKTGECFRLDHLIKSHLEKHLTDKNISTEELKKCEEIVIKLDGMTKNEMGDVLKEYSMKSPITGNDLSEPMEFNLMFSTQIGPSGLIKGFLRPETAQGIFVNFKRLLEFNQGKLPFAAAQIGNAFRNEISPRSGLIRVREFTMAEIEHFCDPNDKSHKKFDDIKNTKIILYSACNQMEGKSAEELTIGDAIINKLVANETLGYFMARIYKFLTTIGIKPDRLRFRQHMSNEMAHYACDCWDAECLTSYGWIECVGCADRSAFDLTQHTTATGVKLTAEKRLAETKIVEELSVLPNKQIMGKMYKANSKLIIDTLKALNSEYIVTLEKQLLNNGNYEFKVGDQIFNLTKEMISVKRSTKVVHVEEITPSVVEPSFGIGRIMYALFEQCYGVRENDEQRSYLSIPASVAPIKCSILPLSNNVSFAPFITTLSNSLAKHSLSYRVDDSSGSIGKRYARTDEIAIPFGITIDFDSLKEPHTVTLRERDSMTQIRLPINKVSEIVEQLSNGTESWENLLNIYPQFTQQEGN